MWGVLVEGSASNNTIGGTASGAPNTIAGNGVANPSFIPQNLQFIYGGTGEAKLNGGIRKFLGSSPLSAGRG